MACPFWSNTQVLWYRKSFVEKAGLDMTKPVTWDQIIDAAAENGGQIGVQANKYEGYVVWINALISGAGGDIVDDAEKGADAHDRHRLRCRRDGGGDHREARRSPRPLRPDLSVSNEGTAPARPSASDAGAFLVNWTYICHNYDARRTPSVDEGHRLRAVPAGQSRARSPARRTAGSASASASTPTHKDLALEAAECLVSPENQGVNAELTGNMPASAAGYDYPALPEIYPADLLQLFQDSVDAAAPRTATPYWSDISSAIQSTWHPPARVDRDTPEKSASFIEEVLHGEELL